VPKAVSARELEMRYATACFVSNRVSGIRRRQLMVK
jgi:purine nucleoside phosphorylase